MVALIALALLGGAAVYGVVLPVGRAHGQSVVPVAGASAAAAPAARGAGAVARPQPPTIDQALRSGVLIVISKASQRMQVFKDGAAWQSSPVSTGRRGHATPAGVFAILEKQKFHRSNIYSNAPMPFMQRLTSGGIAIHAGYVPGHPASHGCIRVPLAFARLLFGLTRISDTAVVIVNAAMQSDKQARQLALAARPSRAVPSAPVGLAYGTAQLPGDAGPALSPTQVTSPTHLTPPTSATQAAPVAQSVPQAETVPRAGQIIQLAAAQSPQEADARWSRLLGLHAELGRLDKMVVPVVAGSRRYFRLRAAGPDAYAYCNRLKGAGIDCFRVL